MRKYTLNLYNVLNQMADSGCNMLVDEPDFGKIFEDVKHGRICFEIDRAPGGPFVTITLTERGING